MMATNIAFYRQQCILHKYSRDEIKQKGKLQEISGKSFRCYLQVINTREYITTKSRKGRISYIPRKEGKLKKHKLNKIISDKKTKSNTEPWGIEATVKALELTEDILY